MLSMKFYLCALTFALAGTVAQATITVGGWTPIYKGIEFATGQADATEPHLQQVRALRVDLLDPDVRLFTTPRLTNAPAGYDTAGQNTSLFLKTYGLQVAINAN